VIRRSTSNLPLQWLPIENDRSGKILTLSNPYEPLNHSKSFINYLTSEIGYRDPYLIIHEQHALLLG